MKEPPRIDLRPLTLPFPERVEAVDVILLTATEKRVRIRTDLTRGELAAALRRIASRVELL